MPKGELAIPLTLPTSQGYVPPKNHITSPKLAAKPETKSVQTAAALRVADRLATDTSPRFSPRALPTDSDPGADKAAELCSTARSTGLAKDMEEQEEGQTILKAQTQTAFQAMTLSLNPEMM